jgi:RIP metalloprotease RseP
MTGFIYAIIALSILIIVHEFGHFIIARLVNVKVITFSLGFGKKLLSWKKGETEYAISAMPLGGYVKLLGESKKCRKRKKNGPLQTKHPSSGFSSSLPDHFSISSLHYSLSIFPLYLTVTVHYQPKSIR